MKTKHWFGFLIILAALAVPSLALAQTPVAPTDRFTWDQDAPTLAAAQAYRADVELDKVILPAPLVTTCTGATSPFVCKAPLPAMTTGTHTARVRVVDTTSILSLIFSDFSLPTTFTMRASPGAPRNLRIEAIVPPTGDAAAGRVIDLGHVPAPGGGQ